MMATFLFPLKETIQRVMIISISPTRVEILTETAIAPMENTPQEEQSERHTQTLITAEWVKHREREGKKRRGRLIERKRIENGRPFNVTSILLFGYVNRSQRAV